MKQARLAVLLFAALVTTSVLAAPLAPPAATAPSAQLPPPTTFTTEIESHFAAWDKNADGILEPAELDALVADKHLTGNTAAALGALKSAQRAAKIPLPPITLDYLHIYEQQIADHKHPIPNFDRSFNRALKKIASPKRELLSGQQPTLDTCHQGPLGDCYFLSVVGAAVARDPATVRKMISTADDGSFIVSFADGRHTHVEPLTDAEIALTSTTTDNGMWLPILEKAYGSIRTASLPQSKQSESTTDAIAHGGSAGRSIQLLTGHATDHISLRPPAPRSVHVTVFGFKTVNKEAQTAATQPTATTILAATTAPAIDPALLAKYLDEVLPKLREHLVASIGDHRLIAAGTSRDGKMPPGISPNHSYAILDYDAKSDTVSLWNPHGNTFTPKADPGIDHGYSTKSGHFTMPLNDFAHVFAGISFETDKSLPAR